jgi:aminoglycoside phosphotransferase (APT) family kinase protein
LHRLIHRTLERRVTVVHGDYSPKNILVRNSRLILLDHEVVHVGDPAFDIGFSMAHLVAKARHLPQYRSALTDAAETYWNAYLDAVAPAPIVDEVACVEHMLGCVLARAAGRSQLEYLSDAEKSNQAYCALGAMRNPPHSVTDTYTILTKKQA